MQEIKADNVIYTFKKDMDPIARVKDGETFKVFTNDCFYCQIKDESQTIEVLDFSRVNPATGPIYIEGAEVGDILKLEILEIEVEDQGVAMTIPGGGALASDQVQAVTRILKVEDGYVEAFGLKLKARPMIGVIGLAPRSEDGEWGTETPWKHGGNMDTKEIEKGNILYLPVGQEGGLLALGDLHAIMGDGELSMTGLEINGSVTLKVSLIKDKKLNWPLLESDQETMVLASGENLEEAIQKGTQEVVGYLNRGLEISYEEAYILASLTTDIKVSQVVNPKKTIRASIGKNILDTEEILKNL